jgi:peptidyl-prolyl cis-trans isomerase C/peptidyl-prolyl cis-trans isomerase D
MRNIILFIAISVSSSAFAQVVFSVGTAKVTVEEFRQRMKEYHDSTYNPPTADQLLEDWIRFEVGVQEAEKQKLQNDPTVKERFRQVLYNGLLEHSLGKKIEDIPITEADLQSYYKTNPEVRLSHIFVEYPAKATDAQREIARKRAQEILVDVKKSLKAGKTFEDLAHIYSDDLATKDQGGDMDFQSRVTLVPPALYETVIKMKIGEISAPIESRQGFHIVKVTGKHAYDEADKRQIRAAVFDVKRGKLFDDFFIKLKKNYPVKVDKKAFQAAQE